MSSPISRGGDPEECSDEWIKFHFMEKYSVGRDDAQTIQELCTLSERICLSLGFAESQTAIFQEKDLLRLTKILKHAHKLTHDSDALKKWASRPNK